MSSHKKDSQYMSIVNDILNNDEFLKIKKIEHHGISRYDHSLKVSYYSYKIAKALHLDFEQTAVGGLLHDFFLSPDDRSQSERLKSVFTHPKEAVNMAKSQFNLSVKEEDMIRSHMFPINLSIPKYAESWIVSMVDKCVATNEFALKFRFRLKYAYNLFLLVAISIMKI